MPFPVALFLLLLALNLGSGRAAEDSPKPPASESTSEIEDSKRASQPSVHDEIGKDCAGVSAINCSQPLTCVAGKCDCYKPTNLIECYCDLHAGDKYRRWEKDTKDGGACKLAYGETPCKPQGQGEKWEMCLPGHVCDSNKSCRISATSGTSPYSVGALLILALIMMILKCI